MKYPESTIKVVAWATLVLALIGVWAKLAEIALQTDEQTIEQELEAEELSLAKMILIDETLHRMIRGSELDCKELRLKLERTVAADD